MARVRRESDGSIAELAATVPRMPIYALGELVPRISRRAGFEWGSGYTINPTTPEEAARHLQEADPDGAAPSPAGSPRGI